MQTTALVTLSALLAAAVGAGTATLLTPDPSTHAAAPASGLDPDDLRALRLELAELRQRMDDVASRPATLATSPGIRASADELEALVRGILAEQAPTPEPQRPQAATASRATLPTDDLLALLLGGTLGHGEIDLLWQELREAGRTDDVLAAIEAWAAEDEADPRRRLELGKAYLNKIQEVGNGPLAGMYAMRADAAFDQALELDPQHWEARFTKGVSLSFWPPNLGKQGAAIQQFEQLVQQQSGMVPQAHHAQTHLFLGNVYQQIGNQEKAIAAWQAGLALFPDDAALQEQVALATGQQ